MLITFMNADIFIADFLIVAVMFLFLYFQKKDNDQEKRREKIVDYIKGISIISIVAIHASTILTNNNIILSMGKPKSLRTLFASIFLYISVLTPFGMTE